MLEHKSARGIGRTCLFSTVAAGAFPAEQRLGQLVERRQHSVRRQASGSIVARTIDLKRLQGSGSLPYPVVLLRAGRRGLVGSAMVIDALVTSHSKRVLAR